MTNTTDPTGLMTDAKQIDDGGPAFPLQYQFICSGMSLRDWFAGQALMGFLASGNWISGGLSKVEQSFIIADAMIAARKEPKP